MNKKANVAKSSKTLKPKDKAVIDKYATNEAMTQREAVAQVYPDKSPSAVHSKAYRVFHSDEAKNYLAELMQSSTDKVADTVQQKCIDLLNAQKFITVKDKLQAVPDNAIQSSAVDRFLKISATQGYQQKSLIDNSVTNQTMNIESKADVESLADATKHMASLLAELKTIRDESQQYKGSHDGTKPS